MALTLDKVVPWGRSLAEYINMFALSSEDLKMNILDCASGPASFNAEMMAQGDRVTSCDPIYRFSVDEIKQRIAETYPIIMQGVKEHITDFVWREIQSPEHLMQVRMAAMNKFLGDFPVGLEEKRYLNLELPALPFTDQQFDLALCSHFLFSYSEQLGEEFHHQAIAEMCRVAREVRIFPLVTVMSSERSPFIESVSDHLATRGYQVEIKQVPYEFQRGGDLMLNIVSKIVSK